MQKIVRSFLVLAVILTSSFGFAQGTQSWQQTSYEDFSKGTAKGVAVASTGHLENAPGFRQLFTSPSTYIWSMVADAKGVVYIGAGSPARVYRVTPDGRSAIIFAPKELQVQALALGADGAVYAATSPDGKVYRLASGMLRTANSAADPTKDKLGDAAGVPVDLAVDSTVFFDPKTKYIWALAFDKEDRLYVATGDRGEIHRVNKDGSGNVFFKSDEAHIRSMVFDHDGNLIAGSDGSGLVYRISPKGEGFVIYSAPKKEITALAIDAAGNIYAAGVGEKRNTASVVTSPFILPSQSGNISIPLVGITPQNVIGGSEVYRIAQDGSPKRLWGAKDDIVYALGFDANGRLLAGTGNKGRLVAIEQNGDFTDLLRASANQLTAFASAPGGMYVATSNLGKLFLFSAKPADDGTFESEVFDAHIFSKWGRTEVRGSGDFDLFTRSGNVDNPDRNWSNWQKIDQKRSAEISAPAARFLQWRVVMHPDSLARLESVKIFYLSKNVAPEVEDVVVQAGARFNNPNQPRSSGETVMVSVGQQNSPFATMTPHVVGPMPALRDRDSVAVRWAVHDENDDDLTYSIYYRGDGESRWKLLKDKITEKFYSWDAGLFPDGGYTIRVLASDSPSHTPEEALTDHRDSTRFEIDNTPPRVDGLSAQREGDQLHVTFSASDTFSPIKRAEFSLDAGEWQFVEPVGRISDAVIENYDFSVSALNVGSSSDSPASQTSGRAKKRIRNKTAKMEAASGPAQINQPEQPPISDEHVIVVRVYDRFDNVGTAKVIAK